MGTRQLGEPPVDQAPEGTAQDPWGRRVAVETRLVGPPSAAEGLEQFHGGTGMGPEGHGGDVRGPDAPEPGPRRRTQ